MLTNYLIWDWNGTLFNDVELCMQSINYLLKKEGLPLLRDKEAYQSVFQFPIIRYYEAVGFDFRKRSFEDLAEDYMKYYQPRSLTLSLHEDALTMLSYFEAAGYTQVLLSASKENYLLDQLAQYPIIHYFKDIIALDNFHAHSKAELAKQYADEQCSDRNRMIFIGDSVHDYEVATYAGGECILIANGHEHKTKLLKTGACVIDRLQELPDVIEK